MMDYRHAIDSSHAWYVITFMILWLICSINDLGLELTFSVAVDENTKSPTTVDLKPNGATLR
jgi:hypothetical protein